MDILKSFFFFVIKEFLSKSFTIVISERRSARGKLFNLFFLTDIGVYLFPRNGSWNTVSQLTGTVSMLHTLLGLQRVLCWCLLLKRTANKLLNYWKFTEAWKLKQWINKSSMQKGQHIFLFSKRISFKGFSHPEDVTFISSSQILPRNWHLEI